MCLSENSSDKSKKSEKSTKIQEKHKNNSNNNDGEICNYKFANAFKGSIGELSEQDFIAGNMNVGACCVKPLYHKKPGGGVRTAATDRDAVSGDKRMTGKRNRESVKQCLFGSVSREETEAFFKEEQQERLEAFIKRYHMSDSDQLGECNTVRPQRIEVTPSLSAATLSYNISLQTDGMASGGNNTQNTPIKETGRPAVTGSRLPSSKINNMRQTLITDAYKKRKMEPTKKISPTTAVTSVSTTNSVATVAISNVTCDSFQSVQTTPLLPTPSER